MTKHIGCNARNVTIFKRERDNFKNEICLFIENFGRYNFIKNGQMQIKKMRPQYWMYWLYYVEAVKSIFDLPYCQNIYFLCLKYYQLLDVVLKAKIISACLSS